MTKTEIVKEVKDIIRNLKEALAEGDKERFKTANYSVAEGRLNEAKAFLKELETVERDELSEAQQFCYEDTLKDLKMMIH